ncbi:hypothetical protein BVRB_031030, partial [Beta vulgaris subsp. vulgaris]
MLIAPWRVVNPNFILSAYSLIRSSRQSGHLVRCVPVASRRCYSHRITSNDSQKSQTDLNMPFGSMDIVTLPNAITGSRIVCT